MNPNGLSAMAVRTIERQRANDGKAMKGRMEAGAILIQ
jgi:hypothetical protein